MASSIANLDGGVAFVTGAGAGIGEETIYAFADAGVDAIALVDLNLENAQAVGEKSKKFARNSSFRTIAVQADVSDEAAVNAAVETTVKEFGRVDYCVHSAGMGNLSGFRTGKIDTEVFDKTIAVNAKGTMLVLRAVTAAMMAQEPRTHTSARHGKERSLGRGSIVVMASINGIFAVPGMMPYAASKYATIGIAKTAAIDNFEKQIRVNTISPSTTDTPMMQASIKRLPHLEKMIESYSPVGRAAMPEEVADSAVFLCSPSASYINGVNLVVDAGFTLTSARSNL